MPVSEKQKQYARAWDKENMRTLSCRVRTDCADIFKDYCAAHDTTPGNLLKKYVFQCIEEYGKELEKAERENAITAEIAAKEKESVNLIAEGKYAEAENTIAELKSLKKARNALKTEK